VQQNPKADVGPVVNLQMIRDFKVEMSFGFLYMAVRLEEQGVKLESNFKREVVMI